MNFCSIKFRPFLLFPSKCPFNYRDGIDRQDDIRRSQFLFSKRTARSSAFDVSFLQIKRISDESPAAKFIVPDVNHHWPRNILK